MTESQKQFRVLGIIIQARKPLTSREVIHISGMKSKEVRRIIRYLRSEGFIG